jgi:Tfp pilus assembly protein PilV
MAVGTKQNGFSVAEVLIAVGILAVAMIFIAGVFPVGIRFTQVSIDRTTAAIVANEAFAKVRLFAGRLTNLNSQSFDLSFTQQRDFNDWFTDHTISYYVDVNTYSYPTDNTVGFDDKQYCWSALLRRTDRFAVDPNEPDSSRDVQVTVFVCGKPRPGAVYYRPYLRHTAFGTDFYGRMTNKTSRLPQPVRLEVKDVSSGGTNELEIENLEEEPLINDGDLIVDDPTGRIYRVMERYAAPRENLILLDRDFVWEDWRGRLITGNRFVWVVPSMWAPGGQPPNFKFAGRSPCVGIYQRVIRF